jgi:thioredoxin reductase (NADPH)
MIEFEEIRVLSVFDGVCDDSLRRAAAYAADVRADAEQWVVREGETAALYVLLAGTLELMKRYPDGLRRLVIYDTPGEYVGELPLVFGAPFLVGARAVSATRLARFAGAQFGSLVAESSALRDRVVARIASRVEGFEAEAGRTLRLPVVLGNANDLDCYALREFLSRNQVRFEWAETSDTWVRARPELARALIAAEACAVVLLPDGRILERPTRGELAAGIGLQVEPSRTQYDLVVVGGGPAGLAAAVYGASEGLGTLLVEREATGGQAGTSTRIENYLGFPSGISGDDLALRAHEQALRLGAEIVVTRSIDSIEPSSSGHVLALDGGHSIAARVVILATGVSYRTLEVDGIDAFAGIGVFYGAARTEAAATKGHDVILVGGGNSAGQAAVFFADYASSVTILIRGASLATSMSRYLIDELARKPNVRVRTRGEVTRCDGDRRLERVTIRNRDDGTIDECPVHDLFVFIGAEANTEWLPHEIVRDDRGFICTGRDVTDLAPDGWPLDRDPFALETSVPGIFAAGDIRHGSIKRVASGVGEGSVAIALAHLHLADARSRGGEGSLIARSSP